MSLRRTGLLSWFGVAALALVVSVGSAWSAGSANGDDDYDRLDGTGRSGKRVHVVEWEGNLEVHVYPKGSLKGLAAVLDKKNKNKPVMVLGLRFDNTPEPLIRRAILGVPFFEGFKAFRDDREVEFDKVILTNNTLASPLIAFQLDAKPGQLYPDGHPANQVAESDKASQRVPAQQGAAGAVKLAPEPAPLEDGQIRPFFMERSGRQ